MKCDFCVGVFAVFVLRFCSLNRIRKHTLHTLHNYNNIYTQQQQYITTYKGMLM